MVTSEKQNAELLADIVKDCREAAKIRRQQNFHPLSARDVAGIYERLADSIERAAAPSPHPRGEPVGYVSAATISALGQPEGSGPVVACAAFDTIIPLYAAPPPAGADAVRAAVIEECAKWHEDRAAPETDSLHCGDNSATIAGAHRVAAFHRFSARELRSALKTTPQPQEKPTGDQT